MAFILSRPQSDKCRHILAPLKFQGPDVLYYSNFFQDSDDEYAAGLTFAPKDCNPIRFQPKPNVHGLGYSGIQTSGDLFSVKPRPAAPAKQGPRSSRGISGQVRPGMVH